MNGHGKPIHGRSRTVLRALALVLAFLLALPAAAFAEGEPADDPFPDHGQSAGPSSVGGEIPASAPSGSTNPADVPADGNDSPADVPAAGSDSPVSADDVPESEPSGDSDGSSAVFLRGAAGPEGLPGAGSSVSYDYNAELYDPDSGDYPGVYSTGPLDPNDDRQESDPVPTIGAPSIADANLADAPTTESPAIIQGAAVGYEEKTGATEYTPIEGRPVPPDPYSEYRVKIMDEQASDGTTHKKLSGFDSTYVIYRLDMSKFLVSEEQYLHMQQENNLALMPAMGLAEGKHEFTDGVGNRTGAYKLSDLLDGGTPFLDVIVFATAANVAGADAGKENTPDGDIPLSLYVDETPDYNPELATYDPASTDPNQDQNFLAKFFDTVKAGVSAVSQYLIKGKDLALEVSVDQSGGENGDETTYWSLKKAIEAPYYDDKAPDSADCGATVKLMSEVAVTEGMTLTGSEEDPKKRTLDVNSFDVQIASNTAGEGDGYSDGFTLENAWLTIKDGSNTTGSEVAIGNNASFVIDRGGKLIIDETCQLEIEWDGETTAPPAEGETAPPPDTLNNGMLDLRAGGEIVNNGIITIEGTEGKPAPDGAEQQAIDSQKGYGEFTIDEGATVTNNGALLVYGKLYNLGTLVNNGKYDDVIESDDPDKGVFDYHKGIQIAWKDDVTQNNIESGSLVNGKDKDGNAAASARLINNGDIVLTPGTLENDATLINASGANIFSAAATEAIIPINPDPADPTVVTRRIELNPVQTSAIINNGTLTNNGLIAPATVALNDNISFGTLTTLGDHPELFSIENNGTIINNGTIYGWINPPKPAVLEAFSGSDRAVDDTWLYLYQDGTFLFVFSDGSRLTGTYSLLDGMLVFILDGGTRFEPVQDADGNWAYTISLSGRTVEFVLSVQVIDRVEKKLEQNETPDRILIP